MIPLRRSHTTKVLCSFTYKVNISFKGHFNVPPPLAVLKKSYYKRVLLMQCCWNGSFLHGFLDKIPMLVPSIHTWDWSVPVIMKITVMNRMNQKCTRIAFLFSDHCNRHLLYDSPDDSENFFCPKSHQSFVPQFTHFKHISIYIIKALCSFI